MSKITNIIEGIANRFRELNEAQKTLFDKRLAICESNKCGMLKFGVCIACGCPVKNKTKVEAEQCPRGFW